MNTLPIYYHAAFSRNSKTGNMLVTTTSKNSCPSTCKHLTNNSCYASFGPIAIHWGKVTNGTRNKGFPYVLEQISKLPNNSVWRYNQAGDLPGHDMYIDANLLQQIADANKHKQGFTYTHKWQNRDYHHLIKSSNQQGFTINISADSIDEAVLASELGIAPVVVTVPHDYPTAKLVYKGVTFITCPAETKKLTCTKCKLCAIPTRKTVIMFHAHGIVKKRWKL